MCSQRGMLLCILGVVHRTGQLLQILLHHKAPLSLALARSQLNENYQILS